MNDLAIRVEQLGKRYRIGKWPKHSHGPKPMFQWLSQPFRYLASTVREPSHEEIFWALQDVSFDVKHGEVVGIIGRNGAGKSTLLKILSRITEPSRGEAKINGRIGALLEVGTGFHEELTGRENTYLSGAILGMRKSEIARKFDEIVDFSGVEKFIDTPVKHYSSGMKVRLGFAVAAHLEPEILLVDEVLAVGDAQFQRKCLGKMDSVSREGRTVLFVSHNLSAVEGLCDRAILLRDGKVEAIDDSASVINQYLTLVREASTSHKWDAFELAPGTEEIKLRQIEIKSPFDNLETRWTVETPLAVYVKLQTLRPASINLSMHLRRLGGETIFSSVSPVTMIEPGTAHYCCEIPGNLLNDGVYTITMMVVEDSSALFVVEDIVTFQIDDIERQGRWWGKWPGAVRPRLNWDISVTSGH
jgi:lipopolysaccharide transport system ATP-binding protein